MVREQRDAFLAESAGDPERGPLTAEAINGGWCGDFNCAVWEACGRPEEILTDDEELGAVEYTHSFLRFDGLFYDAECPEGTPDWTHLPIYGRNGVPKMKPVPRPRRARR